MYVPSAEELDEFQIFPVEVLQANPVLDALEMRATQHLTSAGFGDWAGLIFSTTTDSDSVAQAVLAAGHTHSTNDPINTIRENPGIRGVNILGSRDDWVMILDRVAHLRVREGGDL
jgi:hypothetical protein